MPFPLSIAYALKSNFWFLIRKFWYQSFHLSLGQTKHDGIYYASYIFMLNFYNTAIPIVELHVEISFSIIQISIRLCYMAVQFLYSICLLMMRATISKWFTNFEHADLPRATRIKQFTGKFDWYKFLSMRWYSISSKICYAASSSNIDVTW